MPEVYGPPAAPRRKGNVAKSVWWPIAAEVAQASGLQPEDLLTRSMAKLYCVPRARLWRRLMRLGYSWKAISRVTGHHHATVMSAMRKGLDRFDVENMPAPRRHRANADILGKVFGTLRAEALISSGYGKSNQRLWACTCIVCGTKSKRITVALTSNPKGTCNGCLKHSHRVEQPGIHRRVLQAA